MNAERATRLSETVDGTYSVKNSNEAYTVVELSQLAQDQPERFSPNVTLRAVVQDFLLPTIAYYGGAAEIAYFAQTAEVYRLLDRPATPILPRASLTMVERHTGRVLEKYGLRLVTCLPGRKTFSRAWSRNIWAQRRRNHLRRQGNR